MAYQAPYPGAYPDQQQQYGQVQQYPGQYPEGGEDGERGIGKKLLIGAGVAAVAVGVIGVGAYAYKRHQRTKRRKAVRCSDGKTRDIDCDVMIDENGRELPNQQFDENGNNITPESAIPGAAAGSSAQQSGQIPGPAPWETQGQQAQCQPQIQQQGAWGAAPQVAYGQPQQPLYGAYPSPQQGGYPPVGYPPAVGGYPPQMGGYPAPGFGAPAYPDMSYQQQGGYPPPVGGYPPAPFQ